MPDIRFWLICLSIADCINFKRFTSPKLMTIMPLSAIINSLLIGNNHGFILGHFYFGGLGHYHFGGTEKLGKCPAKVEMSYFYQSRNVLLKEKCSYQYRSHKTVGVVSHVFHLFFHG
jgi:hypothetical protein